MITTAAFEGIQRWLQQLTFCVKDGPRPVCEHCFLSPACGSNILDSEVAADASF